MPAETYDKQLLSKREILLRELLKKRGTFQTMTEVYEYLVREDVKGGALRGWGFDARARAVIQLLETGEIRFGKGVEHIL